MPLVVRSASDILPCSLYSDGSLSSRPQPLGSGGDVTSCEGTREDFGPTTFCCRVVFKCQAYANGLRSIPRLGIQVWQKRHLALQGRVSCRDPAVPVEGSDVAVAAGCQLHPLTRAGHPPQGRPTQGLAGTVPRNGSSVRYPCKSLPVWYVGKFRSSQPALCMALCTLVQMGNLSVSAGLQSFHTRERCRRQEQGHWTRTLPVRHRF